MLYKHHHNAANPSLAGIPAPLLPSVHQHENNYFLDFICFPFPCVFRQAGKSGLCSPILGGYSSPPGINLLSIGSLYIETIFSIVRLLIHLLLIISPQIFLHISMQRYHLPMSYASSFPVLFLKFLFPFCFIDELENSVLC